MALVVLIGGARSGKSQLAVAMAERRGGPVTFVATGQAGDTEMAERIARHRDERPPAWRTVEAPLDVAGAIAAVADDECVIVDCLSLWVANAMAAPDAVDFGVAAARAAARPGLTLAVTNEVGMGVVPASALGREYRDVLGRVNAIWAAAADRTLLVVAGRTLALEAAL